MNSTNAVEASNAKSVSGFDSNIETGTEHHIGWKSLVWLAFAAMVGMSVFMALEHLLFPHLARWGYRALTISAGTVAVVWCGYNLTRKLERLFSAHIQIEKKLAFERNLLRTVVDNIPDSIFAKDSEGRYLLANKAFAKLHGMKSPDDLLGKTAFDLFPKERAMALHTDDLQVMRSGGAETERTAVDAEGNVKVLQTIKVPLIDKNEMVVGIVGLHRDITKRKEAEQKLRQSEANLAAAQRIAHFGSVELDLISLKEPEKNPVRWSDEVFRIFGYEPGVEEPS